MVIPNSSNVARFSASGWDVELDSVSAGLFVADGSSTAGMGLSVGVVFGAQPTTASKHNMPVSTRSFI